MQPLLTKVKRAWAAEANAHALSALRVPRAVAASQTLTADDDLVSVGTRLAVITLTLPTTSPVGAMLEVIDFAGQAATYGIAIAPGGSDVVLGATTISTNYGSRRIFKMAAGVWRAV